MTNEEKLKSMPTEQLACVLAALVGENGGVKKVVHICLDMPDIGFCLGGNTGSFEAVLEVWKKWLKEEAR